MIRTFKNDHDWLNLLWQPLLAIVFLLAILFTLNAYAETKILWAVGAGSLASSSFLVFGQPSSPASRPVKLIGGFLIGIVSGEIMRLLAAYAFNFTGNWATAPDFHMVGVLAALSVGLCLVLMALLKMQHPPAAGMSMVLVLDVRGYYVIAIIIVAAIVLATLRALLDRWLRDLH